MLTKILSLLKMLGAFRVARFLTRNDLRILCYHGFSVGDEHEFNPALFITRDVFVSRLDALAAGGYQVIPLDDAVKQLRRGQLPRHAVVITIDDGFYGTFVHAVPELARRGLPATAYVTTYHVRHQDPIFGLALQYVVWKSTRTTVDLSEIGIDDVVAPRAELASLSRPRLQGLVAAVTLHAATECTRAERQALLAAIAARCDVDYEALLASRMFHLLNADEVAAMSRQGVAVELHTHRHRSWGVEALALSELRENREEIEAIVGRRPVHFCYPSGRYDRYEPRWLQAADVESATTCVPGFVRDTTSPFLLGRFTDSTVVTPIMFEAELSGLLELFRRTRRLFARRDEAFEDDPAEGRPGSMPPTAALQSVVQ